MLFVTLYTTYEKIGLAFHRQQMLCKKCKIFNSKNYTIFFVFSHWLKHEKSILGSYG